MARWYIIAGEASGDLHGSNLMKGLYAADPHAVIRFWGGDMMDAVFHGSGKVPPADHLPGQGAERREAEGALPEPDLSGGLVKDYREGAVIGFSQVLLHPRKFARRLEDCKKDILAWKPDVVVLIDYPGFNFRVAEFAHKAGFKVFYYIAPKVWASREGRIKKLKAYVDKLFIVFPFEIPYFESKGVDFIYKGLNGALRKVLGPSVYQKGSNITKERLRSAIKNEKDNPVYYSYRRYREQIGNKKILTGSILGTIEKLDEPPSAFKEYIPLICSFSV